MPVKYQSDCYRTFDGVRWPNLCDILESQDRKAIAAIKDAGGRVKIRKHPDGYQQAFSHPDDWHLVIKVLRGDQ